MSTVHELDTRTMADVLFQLGAVPAGRVRVTPPPGAATVRDLLRPENKLCELVDGTLVQKPVGQEESFFGMWIGALINQYLDVHNLGYVTGESGPTELSPGTVRSPDVSFFSWDRVPGRRRPKAPIPRLAPELAVEVLSPSNTKREMTLKRGEYFRSGVRLVWEVDLRKKTVTVYEAVDRVTVLTAADTLTGDPVLPRFALPLADLFARLDRHG